MEFTEHTKPGNKLDEKIARLERTVLDARRETDMVLDFTDSGILRIAPDEEMEIISYSKSMLKILRCRVKRFFDIYHSSFACMLYGKSRDELMPKLQDREGSFQIQLKLVRADGSLVPVSCNARLETDSRGDNYYSLFLTDISDIVYARHNVASLRMQVQRDSLTGLYNKATTESLVESILMESPPDARHALMVIDIDDFKNVNNTLGHLCGDAVLKSVASLISSMFRNKDVVGRIGGDEFMVLLKDINEYGMARRKARTLLREAAKLDPGCDCTPSLSIGVACYPKNGALFGELFGKADKALCTTKQNGKNSFTVYGETSANSDGRTAPSRQKARVEFRGNSAMENIYAALYEAASPRDAINAVLAVLGKFFDVSRAYIFQNSPDGKYHKNTFEWCAPGITSEKSYMQALDYSKMGDPYGHLRNRGIFYATNANSLDGGFRDTLLSQGVVSVLLVALRQNGNFQGFVGFDECARQRLWVKQEIETLTFAARIIDLLLVRLEIAGDPGALQKKDDRTYRNFYIYAIDKATYELLYINRNTYNLTPKLRLGNTCFNAYHQLDRPCKGCPLEALDDTHNINTSNVCDSARGVSANVTGTEVEWAPGRMAYLLSSCDTSEC